MKPNSLLVAALLSSLIFSCNKEVNVHCTPSWGIVYFAHFDSTDIRTLTIYRFPKGQAFQQAVDTLVLNLIYRSPSTLASYNANMDGDVISAGNLNVRFDYIIEAAPVGKRWKISDITWRDEVSSQRSQSTYEFQCPLDEYTVDSARIRGGAIFLE